MQPMAQNMARIDSAYRVEFRKRAGGPLQVLAFPTKDDAILFARAHGQRGDDVVEVRFGCAGVLIRSFGRAVA